MKVNLFIQGALCTLPLCVQAQEKKYRSKIKNLRKEMLVQRDAVADNNTAFWKNFEF